MPAKYPSYPYAEVIACDFDDAQIADTVDDLLSQNKAVNVSDGKPLDGLCRALNVDLEYSPPPYDLVLDVPLDRKAVIWLPRDGKLRHDRMATAIAIGHWILHVPVTREAFPRHGVQAVRRPSDPKALIEARHFAFALLMPEPQFRNLWYEGKASLVAEALCVPTQAAYERAKLLDLHADESGHKFEWKERPQIATGF
ncbi:ImmA/IrrE family metallo-endopeptidase [Citreimonas sp.]|uniref:ImmA/IrrE family metallo-endopeptidase n=1 Tax=Citreimonas sp. TaxID=3036715 RepID=UPI0035C84D74